MIESEKYLEPKFKNAIKRKGGICLKIAYVFIGMPDRICLMPGGIVFFAEIKTTGFQPSKVQLSVHNRLRRLGFNVYIVDSSEIIKKLTGDDVSI